MVCKDVVMVGLGDYKFQIQLLQWSLGIMQTGILHSLKNMFKAINDQTSPSLAHFADQDSCFQVTDRQCKLADAKKGIYRLMQLGGSHVSGHLGGSVS